MTSAALSDWEFRRQQRLNDLLKAHNALGGSRPGRRWTTEQLNWALVLRLAGEFQGFARDLHDEASDFFAIHGSGLNSALELQLRILLTDRRQLDRGNAHPGNLGEDFGRLGIKLWPALKAQSIRASEWNERLSALNEARNAIAHDDVTKLTEIRNSGFNVSLLSTMKKFHTTTSQLTRAMDRVVGDHLNALFGGRPW